MGLDTAESEFPFHTVFLRSLCCTLVLPVDLSLDTVPLYIKQHIHHSWSSQLECIFHIFSVLLSVLFSTLDASPPALNGSTTRRHRQQQEEERRRETAAPPPWRRPVAHPARLLLLRLFRERVSTCNHTQSCIDVTQQPSSTEIRKQVFPATRPAGPRCVENLLISKLVLY